METIKQDNNYTERKLACKAKYHYPRCNNYFATGKPANRNH